MLYTWNLYSIVNQLYLNKENNKYYLNSECVGLPMWSSG